MENLPKYLEIIAAASLSGGIYTLYKGIVKPKVLPVLSVNDPERFKKINRHFMADKEGLLKTGSLMMAVGIIIFVAAIVLG